MTHGGVGVPVSAQPATTYGVARVTTGCPDTSTRGNGAVGVACPRVGAHHRGAEVDDRAGHRSPPHITVSAPALTSTAGPIIVIAAPLPLLIDDADVADRDHRAGRGLDQDPAGGPGGVADRDAVLQRASGT